MSLISGIVNKPVGKDWIVECNKDNYTVTIFCKGKKMYSYQFDKFYRAMAFFGKLKKVKDMKNCEDLAEYYKYY